MFNHISDFLIKLFNQPHVFKGMTDKEWEPIIFVLRHEKLLARYAYKLIDSGQFDLLSDYPKKHFNNAITLAVRQAEQVFREANYLSNHIAKYSPYMIFLKGAGYTLTRHPVGRGRVYSDIDILVEKSSLDSVEKHLCIRDWVSEPINDYDNKYYRKWAHEIPPLRNASRGTILDIHHNIVPVISGKAPNVELLTKHVIITDDGHQVLSPAAMTLHSAIHLFFNEDFKHGFRDMLDIHILITNSGDDSFWKELLFIAKKTNFTKELVLACHFAHEIWGSDIPKEINEALANFKYIITPSHNFIFKRILLPKHPLASEKWLSIADFLGWVRGHWLKMPLHILIYHFTVKSFRYFIERVLGAHFFTPNEDAKR